MEHTAKLAPDNPEVMYDLAVIRLAAGKKSDALEALQKAIELNPKLKMQAKGDADMSSVKDDPQFLLIVE
jgi:cytochrome c-type biogenesis protein CcmH/NrfG